MPSRFDSTDENATGAKAVVDIADLAASISAGPSPPPKLRNLTIPQPVLQLRQLLFYSTPQKQRPNNASQPVTTQAV